MARVIVVTFAIAFSALMTYAVYLQAKIFHLI